MHVLMTPHQRLFARPWRHPHARDGPGSAVHLGCVRYVLQPRGASALLG